MKKLKVAIAMLVALAFAFQPSMLMARGGTAIGAQGTLQTRVNPVDGNGQIMDPTTVGYKVFEVMRWQTAVQLIDERGRAPSNGLVHQVCVETGTLGTAQNDYVILFDSNSISGMGHGLTSTNFSGSAIEGRKLAPPIYRATLTERCVVLDAQFTSGVVSGSSTDASYYIYWRPNGGRD